MPKRPSLKSITELPKPNASAVKVSQPIKTPKTVIERKTKGTFKKATVYFRPEQWRLLRIRAAEKDTDISRLLRDLVDSTLARG